MDLVSRGGDVPDGSDLIANPEYANPGRPLDFYGVDGFESASNIVQAALAGLGIGAGGDWDHFSMTADGTLAALEMLNYAANPFGALMSAGIEFIVEYVPIAKWAVDHVTGDPAAVLALSETWGNIAQELYEAANDYESALAAVVTWNGDTAAAYGAMANEVVTALRGTAAVTVDAAKGVLTAALMVATTRSVILEIIAYWAMWALLRFIASKAMAVPSMGASVATWLAHEIVQALILAAKIALKLAKLVHASELYSGKFTQMAEGAAGLAAAEQSLTAQINSNSSHPQFGLA